MDSGVEIETKYFVLSFLLVIFPVLAAIDGAAPIKIRWGKTFIPLAPGQHQVQVFWKLYWAIPVGRTTNVVDVPPGGVVGTSYYVPWLWFLGSKWQVLGVRGPAATDQQMLPPSAAAAPQALPQGMPMQQQAQPVAQPMGGGGGGGAGWNPDPSGRHQLRYWDGSGWTPNVSDNGVTSVDPLG